MAQRRVVVVGYDGLELLDVASVTSSLDLANRLGATPAYDISLATLSGGPVRCDSGLHVQAQFALPDVRGALDTLIVSGGLGHSTAAADPALLDQVRRLARRARRVASICTGATVLAAAGLLEGRRATTHWHYADEFAARFPGVRVDPAPIFVQDEHVWTSGGVTAAIDLALAFVEADHGAERARWVAMGLVTYLQRPGNQAQMSMFVRARRPDHDVVRRVLDHVTAHPDADLSAAGRQARREISRFPHNERTRMPGSSTTQGRAGARLTHTPVLPSGETTPSAPWTSHLSRLDTQPTRAPVNASPRPRGSSTHDSGPVWCARPSL